MNLNELSNRVLRYPKYTRFKTIFSEKELEYIKSEAILWRKRGNSAVDFSRKYNFGRGGMQNLFKKSGLTNAKLNTIEVNRPDLFEKILTEEDAYWLGFILADGYISKNGNFEISLKLTDYKHLLKFAKYCKLPKTYVKKKLINNIHSGKIKKTYYSCKIAFRVGSLKKNFSTLGIVPRKSLILEYPNNIPNHLHRHLIRGYFDGDGSIYIRNRKSKHKTKKEIGISIAGTHSFLTALNINSNFPTKKLYIHGNIHTIVYNGKQAIDFAHYMYENSTIHLDRKFLKYKQNCPYIKKLI